MDRSSVRVDFALSPEFLGVRKDLRCAWYDLHAFCARQENGGRIDLRMLPARFLGLDRRVIRAFVAANLAIEFDENTIELVGYDIRGEEWMRAQRERGARGGRARARRGGGGSTPTPAPTRDRAAVHAQRKATSAEDPGIFPGSSRDLFGSSERNPASDADLPLATLPIDRSIDRDQDPDPSAARESESTPPPPDRSAAVADGGGGPASRVEPETDAAARRVFETFPLVKAPEFRWPTFRMAFLALTMNAAELADVEAAAKQARTGVPDAKVPNPERWLTLYWTPRLQRRRASEARTNAAAAEADRARLRAKPPQLEVIAGGGPVTYAPPPGGFEAFARELAEAKGGAL